MTFIFEEKIELKNSTECDGCSKLRFRGCTLAHCLALDVDFWIEKNKAGKLTIKRLKECPLIEKS